MELKRFETYEHAQSNRDSNRDSGKPNDNIATEMYKFFNDTVDDGNSDKTALELTAKHFKMSEDDVLRDIETAYPGTVQLEEATEAPAEEVVEEKVTTFPASHVLALARLLDGLAGVVSEGKIETSSYWKNFDDDVSTLMDFLKTADPDEYKKLKEYF